MLNIILFFHKKKHFSVKLKLNVEKNDKMDSLLFDHHHFFGDRVFAVDD